MVTASYPDGVISYSTKQDRVDVVDDDHINQLQVEQIALQQYVGTNPHGDKASIADRLNAMLNPSGYLISSAGVPQPTAPGFFWYDSDADVMKVIKLDGTVKSVGGSLSNVIFDSTAEVWNTANNSFGYIVNTNSWTPTISGNANRIFWGHPSVGTGWGNQVRPPFFWEKISGINNLVAYAPIWADIAQGVRFSFGNSTDGTSACPSITQTAPILISSCSLDVSGLGNGTTYLFQIEMNRASTTGNAYMGRLIVLAQ